MSCNMYARFHVHFASPGLGFSRLVLRIQKCELSVPGGRPFFEGRNGFTILDKPICRNA